MYRIEFHNVMVFEADDDYPRRALGLPKDIDPEKLEQARRREFKEDPEYKQGWAAEMRRLRSF
jgi:hypothetical protein